MTTGQPEAALFGYARDQGDGAPRAAGTGSGRRDGDAEPPAVLGGFDLTDQAAFAGGFPHDAFAALRREMPVLWHPPGQSVDGEGFWVLSRHADIVAAAAHPVFSSQGGGGRTGGGSHLDDLVTGVHAGVMLPMMDDPRHALIAEMVRPSLGRSAVAAHEEALGASAAELVDRALALGTCDFATDVAGPFAMRAIALALGAPRGDWEELQVWGDSVVGIVDRRTGRVDERTKQTNLDVYRYCQHLLAAKRAHPSADLATAVALGEIATDRGEAPLSEYEREMNVCLLLQTGGEQPRNTIAGGVLALAQHADQWHALRADRSLVPTAVEEMLRWSPPNPYNRRTATRDVEFRETRIRAGDKVTLWWASANRDDAVFEEPDAFDVRRDPNPHLAFGAGGHSCLGDRLARAEMRLLLEALLDRVAEIRVVGPTAWAPSNKHAVVVDMPVELLPAAGAAYS